MTYKRIWVTGGTGLTGRSLQDITEEYPDRTFIFSGSQDCNLTDLSAVTEFIRTHRVEAILHLAAQAGGIEFTRKYPGTMLRENVLMNQYVADAARACGVGKVVMSLSAGMYPEDAPNPIKEEYIHDGQPTIQNYSYAFAKRLVDPLIRSYREEYGMNIIGLVPNGIFGEYMNYNREAAVMVGALIRRFYEEKNRGEPLIVWGDGTPLREYTYGKDLARAYMWCLDHYEDAQFLNVGSTEEHSIREIAEMIAQNLDIPVERLHFDTSKPSGIAKKSTDNSRFVGVSGFKYTPFAEGLKLTIDWFKKYYGDCTRVRL